MAVPNTKTAYSFMIIGKIHPGSGLGDQLFSYIITRVIALDKGYDFGFVGKEFFKGASFMNLDWGVKVPLNYKVIPESGALEIVGHPYQLVLPEFKFDKPYYDPEVNFIQDGTIIDGWGAQDERYWGHRLDEIREWLKVEPYKTFLQESTIIINFRGGEYTQVPDLFLPKRYWQRDAVNEITKDNKFHRFEIHTDDPITARQFFPREMDPIIQDISKNWRAIRYAENLIISNSAFAIIPALLNQDAKKIIAPRYWAGRNVGEWRRPQNYYKKFIYV